MAFLDKSVIFRPYFVAAGQSFAWSVEQASAEAQPHVATGMVFPRGEWRWGPIVLLGLMVEGGWAPRSAVLHTRLLYFKF